MNTITFKRLEGDYSDLGTIRSIEVDHGRQRIVLICDEPPDGPNEGATVKPGINLNSTYDEVVTP